MYQNPIGSCVMAGSLLLASLGCSFFKNGFCWAQKKNLRLAALLCGFF